MEKNLTKRKVYGVLANGVLTRTVLFKKHYFWKYKGYAFGVDFLNAIEKKHGRIDTLKIVEQDTGKEFTISYQDFLLLSEVIYTNYGKQRVIDLVHCETKTEQHETEQNRNVTNTPGR
jgi:hypothetical protein